MPKDKTLSELQMAIMRVLWELQEASVSEVHNTLIQQNRELAPTTVSTMLSRLEKRGLISHRTESRQYIYSPQVSETEVRRSMVRDLVGRLFQGDVAAMVSHLVKESDIADDDLENIKSLIDEKENEEQQK